MQRMKPWISGPITGHRKGKAAMEKFRIKLQQFMYGRYGQDELSQTLIAGAILLLLLSMFPHMRAAYYLSLLLICLALFRILSKNREKRFREREMFLKRTDRPKRFFRIQIRRFKERKTYDYYRCGKCGTYNRIPKGHGRIIITCPKCHNQFERK